MITEDQKKTYLEHPNQCPRCDGEIFETDISYDSNYVWRSFSCRKCQLDFIEEYTLTTITEANN